MGNELGTGHLLGMLLSRASGRGCGFRRGKLLSRAVGEYRKACAEGTVKVPPAKCFSKCDWLFDD